MVGMQMDPALGWQSQGSYMEVLGQRDWKKRQGRLLQSPTLEAGRASQII